MKNIPNPADVSTKFGVNMPNTVEGIAWNLYDIQTYTTAGAREFSFFQVPQGQSSKTLEDTNMELAGQLPAPQAFLVETVQFQFLSGGELIDAATVAGENAANDSWKVLKNGSLEFSIGSKSYAKGAPLLSFPPAQRLVFNGAVSNTTTTTVGAAGYADATGLLHDTGGLLIPQSQNFNVKVRFKDLLTIATESRIKVTLSGILYRSRM